MTHTIECHKTVEAPISQVLFTEAEIRTRVRALGEAISHDYAGQTPLLVGVLKGVLVFMADLLRAITIPVKVDFMSISSYNPQTREQGVVRIVKDLSTPVTDQHVVFVEDVIDTGLTLDYLLRYLRSQQPASLQVCVLFNRTARRLIDIPLPYVGFDVPDRFLIGYGLDFREKYRSLPYVGILHPDALAGNLPKTGKETRNDKPSHQDPARVG